MRIGGIPEDVEPIADFDALCEGVPVWIIACEICPGGPSHRVVIAGKYDGCIEDAYGEVKHGTGWLYSPPTPCGAEVFDRRDVEQGFIYRVAPGVLQ